MKTPGVVPFRGVCWHEISGPLNSVEVRDVTFEFALQAARFD